MVSPRITLAVFSASRTRWRGWSVGHHIVSLQRTFNVHCTGCSSSIASPTKWWWWTSRSGYTSNHCISPSMSSTTDRREHWGRPIRTWWPSPEPRHWSRHVPSAQSGTACYQSRVPRHPFRHSKVVSSHSCLTSLTMIIHDLSHSTPLTRCIKTSLPCRSLVKLMVPGESKQMLFNWLID